MPNILVVGGNGFLGSHLVDALAAQEGTFIRAFDMFGNGEHWKALGVEAFDGNFLNNDDIARAVSGMDVVVHMLSTTSKTTRRWTCAPTSRAASICSARAWTPG